MSTTNDENVAATKKTYDKIHEQYASSNPILRDDVRGFLDRFMSYLSGKRVLDIGCAGGYESEYLSKHSLDVSGCDISEKFVAMAQKRCPDCRFFVADMRHIAEPPSSYDGIWANASFLHIPKTDALKTLEGFHDLLKEKGILCVSVMEGDFDGLRENKDMNWAERHFSDYKSDELEGMLKQAGFHILYDASSKKDWGVNFLVYFCQKDQPN